MLCAITDENNGDRLKTFANLKEVIEKFIFNNMFSYELCNEPNICKFVTQDQIVQFPCNLYEIYIICLKNNHNIKN